MKLLSLKWENLQNWLKIKDQHRYNDQIEKDKETLIKKHNDFNKKLFSYLQADLNKYK